MNGNLNVEVKGCLKVNSNLYTGEKYGKGGLNGRYGKEMLGA